MLCHTTELVMLLIEVIKWPSRPDFTLFSGRSLVKKDMGLKPYLDLKI